MTIWPTLGAPSFRCSNSVPAHRYSYWAGRAKYWAIAAGLAVRHGARLVDYVDDRIQRLEIAEQFGARAVRRNGDWLEELRHRRRGILNPRGVDTALRTLNPGGVCTAVGWYLAPGTKVPLMHMYANDATCGWESATCGPY